MKFKLFAALLVGFTVVSCNKKKAEVETTEEETPVETIEEAKPSVVSGALAEVVHKFDGEKYVSTQLSHKPDYFFVYSGASWCGPCRKNSAKLVETYNSKISKVDNIELIMLSGDKNVKQAESWAKKEKFPWPTVLRKDRHLEIFKALNLRRYPIYVLYDKDGKELARHFGPVMRKLAEVSKEFAALDKK